MTVVLVAVAAAFVGLLATAAVLILSRSFTAGIWLVLGCFALDIATAGLPAFHAGLNIFPTDAMAAVLAASAALRLARRPALLLHPIVLAWLLLGALIAFSLTVGLARYGSSAGVTARNDAYFWICTLYFCSFRLDSRQLDWFFRTVVLTSVFLCGLCAMRWTTDVLGLSNYTRIGAGVPFRVEPSVAADAISLSVLAVWGGFRLRSDRRRRAFLIISMVIILVLQHRSVWLATAAGFLLLALDARRRRLATIGRYAIMATAIAAGMIVASQFSPTRRVVAAVSDAFSSGTTLKSGTTYARIAGWNELLTQWWAQGPATVTYGSTYGASITREVENPETGADVVESFSAHNYYVESLYYLGIAGTLLWLFVYASVCLKLKRRGMFLHDLHPRLLFAFLVSSLVYFVAYQASYIHGVVLGISIGVVLGPAAQEVIGTTTISHATGSDT